METLRYTIFTDPLSIVIHLPDGSEVCLTMNDFQNMMSAYRMASDGGNLVDILRKLDGIE